MDGDVGATLDVALFVVGLVVLGVLIARAVPLVMDVRVEGTTSRDGDSKDGTSR